MVRNEANEIKDIIGQLKQLQITQTALLERLERLEEDENPTPPAPTVPLLRRLTARRVGTFVIGDRVRVTNPNRGQLDIGHITSIGPRQITLIDRRGEDIRRAPKNLVLENELVGPTTGNGIRQ
jgi:hypothetical protein